ncbi:hypothetical protein DTO027B9_1995 [Paecilomyces variotii]|nr:hypothetical protein DTO027B9_1995 [Paecilomyces variotii]
MFTMMPESTPVFHVVRANYWTTETLKRLLFLTDCPPDVGPRIRLIAVCGITDDYDHASPTKDGWFFSDFYLLHYLSSTSSVAIIIGSDDNEVPPIRKRAAAHVLPPQPKRQRRKRVDTIATQQHLAS